jgi:hypothetical protein
LIAFDHSPAAVIPKLFIDDLIWPAHWSQGFCVLSAIVSEVWPWKHICRMER